MITKYVLSNFINKNRNKVFLYILLTLIIFTFQSIGLPITLGKLLKLLTNYKYFKLSLKNENNLELFKVAAIFLILWLIILILGAIKNNLEKDLIPKYLGYLRNMLFNSIIKKYSDKYDDIKIGDTLGRILDISRNMKDCFQMVIVTILPQLIAILIISISLLFIDFRLGIIIFIILFIYFIFSYINNKKILDISIKREYNFALMNEKLSDNFSNLMNIYINNQQENVIKQNNILEKEYTKIYSKEFFKQGQLITINSGLIIIIIFVTIVYGIYKLYHKTILKDKYITFLLIITFFITYCINLNVDIPNCMSKLGTIMQSKDFLENLLTSNIKKVFNNENKKDISGNIDFKNVYFRYPNANNYILNNLSFSIKKGDRLGILGKSGSGKTTIMKLILKMYKVNSGNILIENEDLDLIDTNHIRNNISYINQRTVMFNDTIINNLKYGNNYSSSFIISFLKKYNLYELYSRLDKKLDSLAGVNGNNLSLGMQKVIFICRGIFRGTSIIIFDEPLAGLDKKTREKILNLIINECVNKTILVITHDKEIIPYMTRIIYMDELLNLGNLSTNQEESTLTYDNNILLNNDIKNIS